MLQSHYSPALRDTLLEACLTDLRYDRQCEESRAPYLFELIALTGETEFFRRHLLTALLLPCDDSYLYQRLELIRLFAAEGDAEARSALYQYFLKSAEQEEFAGADQIVTLDGLNGFLFVIQRMAKAEDIVYLREAEMLVWELENRDGEEEAWAELDRAAQDLPELAELVRLLREEKAQQEQGREADKQAPRLDYAAVRERIQTFGRQARGLRAWVQKASEEELQMAAEDLLKETDRDKKIMYLRFFHSRVFPGDFRQLFPLVLNDYWPLAYAAADALAPIQHNEVRRFALETAENPERRSQAIRILTINYQEGDYLLLERLLGEQADAFLYHSLIIAVRNFAEQNLLPEAERTLLQAYEKSPCSLCREGIVRSLAQLQLMPEWMRLECLHDSEPGIRKMAQSYPNYSEED